MTMRIHKAIFWPAARYVVVSHATVVASLLWIGIIVFMTLKAPKVFDGESAGVLWIMHSNFFLVYTVGLLLQSYEFLGADYLGYFLPKPVSRPQYLVSIVAANLVSTAIVNLMSYVPLLPIAPLTSGGFWKSIGTLYVTEMFVFAAMLTGSMLLTILFRSRIISQSVPIILLSLWMGSGLLFKWLMVPALSPDLRLYAFLGGTAIAIFLLAEFAFSRKDIA
ncbi:MAG: hypothetical protein AB1428_08885 [Bacteroidota bacterium]